MITLLSAPHREVRGEFDIQGMLHRIVWGFHCKIEVTDESEPWAQ